MSIPSGDRLTQEVPEGFITLGLNYVLWFAPGTSLGLAALLACLRRRRRRDATRDPLESRTWANFSKWLLRIERPGDGLFAMEEMGRGCSAALSVVIISGVLIPWCLYVFALVTTGIMCAVESWPFKQSLESQFFAMGVLLYPANNVRPVTLSGKIWCVLIGLFVFVLVQSIYGVLTITRINSVFGDLCCQRSGMQAFIIVVLVPMCLVVVGFVIALTLTTEGLDLAHGMLGGMDFITTGGAFGLLDPFSFAWPTGILFVQLCLIFSTWFQSLIIGLVGQHPSVTAFMVFLEGSDKDPADPLGFDKVSMRGTARDSKFVRQSSHVSSTSHQSKGSGFRGTFSQQHTRGSTSMETVLQQEAAKARREDEMRNQLTEMGVGTRATATEPRRPSAWVSAFQAPEVANPAAQQQAESEKGSSSGDVESAEQQVATEETKEVLQEKLKTAAFSAMTEKGYRIAAQVNKEGWEKSSFPILCETCLGDNPYVRMQKEDYGVECKICVRPFTIFRWKAGTKGRYKATVICQSCAKIKNVCQTCLFDLEFGLPVQVRDKFLEEQGQSKIALPASRVGRDYQLQEAQKAADGNDLPYGKVSAHPMLQRLARMTPYYKRNEARICTFYVKGACNRGQDCPFRHELPEGGELANQKLRDRFHGENDPVANKLLRRADEEMTLLPPEDKSITTLYIGGLEAGVKDKDVRDKLYVFGEISSIRLVPRQGCAFVEFAKREVAEEAASQLHRILQINGKRVSLFWARPQGSKQDASGSLAVPGAGAGAPGSSGVSGSGDVYRPYYPSMDPMAQGNAPLEAELPDQRGPP